jgi:hypothetical protein
LEKSKPDEGFIIRPCTLDTVVFAQLALHLYPSLTHPILSLRLHLNFPRLVDFVSRMKDKVNYLPLVQPVPQSLWQQLREISNRLHDIWPSWSFIQIQCQIFSADPDIRKEQLQRLLAMATGFTVFVGYVFSSGLIQVQSVKR